MLTLIRVKVFGVQRDVNGRFVRGNAYRIRKNASGFPYMPDGATPDGKAYNQKMVVRGKG